MAGAWVGAAALTGGRVRRGGRQPLHGRAAPCASISANPRTSVMLSYREIFDFYLPLALTSTIALAVQPMVTFFMGQARFPLESLAVLPVVNSLVFIFRTPGLSLPGSGHHHAGPQLGQLPAGAPFRRSCWDWRRPPGWP